MSKTRTVLVLSNHGEIVGGGEVSLLALLKGLDRSRWATVVVVPSEGAVAVGCRALGLPTHVIPLPSLRRPGPATLRSLVALHRLVKGSGSTLLHANGSRAMLYAGLTGRLARRPVIWHARVADPDHLLDRLLASLAHAVIVNSNAVRRRFSWAPADKVHCIYNGVDLAPFSPRPSSPGLRASLGLPQGVRVAGSIGRFVAYKGYHHLLEAAAMVREKFPDLHWVLVGEGKLRGDLERQCRRFGLERTVRLTGWQERIPEHLALFDLFVLPSLGEHFGRVILEAMAMEKAVVATDAGGVPEIVLDGETGILVPPADPAAMAAAVISLIEDPAKAARLGEAGRRRVASEFTLARHVDAVDRLYASLLDETGERL
ncbi:MAG: glycosyltransferase family 4 protein [Candidatus Methylomirabilia bacterium]